MSTGAATKDAGKCGAEFGIYILTYPGDYHLSTVLVSSIRALDPDIPIIIIPGEGFDETDHPFDVPVMPRPGGFWGTIGFQDRDFWAFQGPFETFLYLDADTICTKSLAPLATRIRAQQGNFIYVQPWMSPAEWQEAAGNVGHPRHGQTRTRIARTVGRGPLSEFDPEHDFGAHFPFNSGIFASRRLAITEHDLMELNRRERAFYAANLGITEWTWKSSALFFRDQGRLNYLVHKLGIAVYPLAPEVVCTSGASASQVFVEGVARGDHPFNIIHWMGAKSPSPSLFCAGLLFRFHAHLWSAVGRESGRWIEPGYERLPECPGYALWRYHRERTAGPIRWRERLHGTWRDVTKTAKLIQRYLRLFRSPFRKEKHRKSPRPPLRPGRGDGILGVSGDRPDPVPSGPPALRSAVPVPPDVNSG